MLYRYPLKIQRTKFWKIFKFRAYLKSNTLVGRWHKSLSTPQWSFDIPKQMLRTMIMYTTHRRACKSIVCNITESIRLKGAFSISCKKVNEYTIALFEKSQMRTKFWYYQDKIIFFKYTFLLPMLMVISEEITRTERMKSIMIYFFIFFILPIFSHSGAMLL